MRSCPLTTEVSDRICKHMNTDHNESVIAYAKHYGRLDVVIAAKMIAITPVSMELNVDGQLIQIPFDHELTDSSDAHKTLVSMARKCPAN